MRENIQGVLERGDAFISDASEYTFRAYDVVSLPTDKFVFLVKKKDFPVKKVKGVLHYDSRLFQRATENIAVNTVQFITNEPLFSNFNETNRRLVYLADGKGFKFFFSELSGHYDGVDITGGGKASNPRYDRPAEYKEQPHNFFYQGDAILPSFYATIIDDLASFNQNFTTVSNSFPKWLFFDSATLPIYPASLLPTNIRPPYVVVEVVDTKTYGLFNYERGVLAEDSCKITLYGLRNTDAHLLLDRVLDAFRNDDVDFGLLSNQGVIDESETQDEVGILNIKKSFMIKVSYVKKFSEPVPVKALGQLILKANLDFKL